MPTKRLIVPDDVPGLMPGKKNARSIRLLQYTNATTSENFDAILTHHALVYILSGVKQIKVADTDYRIQPGELFLIPKGEYVMSEYIIGKNGFQSLMLFFSSKMAQEILSQLDEAVSNTGSETAGSRKAAVKIIPHIPEVFQVFHSLEIYSNKQTPFLSELIRIRFMELVYLLLDSPYKKLILSFLLDASKDEQPDLMTIVSNYLYTPVTVAELAVLSGRSLSGFKREFAGLYQQPPHQWMNEKRLERAAFLLRTTRKSIEEVAEQSGYVSPTHFSRLFKKYFLLTPTEYRTKQADE